MFGETGHLLFGGRGRPGTTGFEITSAPQKLTELLDTRRPLWIAQPIIAARFADILSAEIFRGSLPAPTEPRHQTLERCNVRPSGVERKSSLQRPRREGVHDPAEEGELTV